MNLYESVRIRQADIINQNKASIIISRVTRTSDGAGGYTESLPIPQASQDFRIYDATFRDMATLTINDGGYHKSRIKKMIALWNADIEAENETFLDTFSHGGRDFKVVDVKDKTTQGFVVYKECFIEEIV